MSGGVVSVVVVSGGAVVVVVSGGVVSVVVVSGGAVVVVVVSFGFVVVVVVSFGFVVVVVVCFGLVVVVVVGGGGGGGKKKIGVVVVVVVGCGGFVVVVVLGEVFPTGMIGKTAVSGAVWTLGDVELVVFFAAVLAETAAPVLAVVGAVAGVPVVEVDGGGGISTGSCAPVDVVTSPLVC